jgi:glycosyltransferase involved in cell wall biosynthesis
MTTTDASGSVARRRERAPRLTVGLPVYNGEPYLRAALDCVLAQTYTDFELVISDNASTDATAAICQEYAARDPRIRYVRQPRNIGISPNHNALVDLARGEYFKWFAHDDLIEPTMLERCVEYLDDHPEAALCHVGIGFIDEHGNRFGTYTYTAETEDPSPSRRFKSLLHTDGGDDMYGVIRTSVVRAILPWGSHHHEGRPGVAEMALHGTFHQVPEVLFLRRDHPDRGDRAPSIKEHCVRLDPRRRHTPTAVLVAEYLVRYFRVVHRSPISRRERAACYGHLVSWIATHGLPPRHRRTELVLADAGAA